MRKWRWVLNVSMHKSLPLLKWWNAWSRVTQLRKLLRRVAEKPDTSMNRATVEYRDPLDFRQWQHLPPRDTRPTFHLILLKKNSFEIFCQGLKWRCCIFKRLFCWPISFFVQVGILMGGPITRKKSIWFNFLSIFNFKILETYRLDFFWKKCPSKLSCQSSISFWNWFGVFKIFFAPHWRKISPCNCVSCLDFPFFRFLRVQCVCAFYNEIFCFYWIFGALKFKIWAFKRSRTSKY